MHIGFSQEFSWKLSANFIDKNCTNVTLCFKMARRCPCRGRPPRETYREKKIHIGFAKLEILPRGSPPTRPTREVKVGKGGNGSGGMAAFFRRCPCRGLNSHWIKKTGLRKFENPEVPMPASGCIRTSKFKVPKFELRKFEFRKFRCQHLDAGIWMPASGTWHTDCMRNCAKASEKR